MATRYVPGTIGSYPVLPTITVRTPVPPTDTGGASTEIEAGLDPWLVACAKLFDKKESVKKHDMRIFFIVSGFIATTW